VAAASLPLATPTLARMFDRPATGRSLLLGAVLVATAGAGGVGGSGIPTISLNWSGYAATSAKKFNYVHCSGAPRPGGRHFLLRQPF
jgi:hypothetical protein